MDVYYLQASSSSIDLLIQRIPRKCIKLYNPLRSWSKWEACTRCSVYTVYYIAFMKCAIYIMGRASKRIATKARKWQLSDGISFEKASGAKIFYDEPLQDFNAQDPDT